MMENEPVDAHALIWQAQQQVVGVTNHANHVAINDTAEKEDAHEND